MRILLAEDDRIISQGLIAALRKSGYAVDHVNNGADADTALLSQPYDLLLLDLGLPKLPGIEVLKRLRARKVATPVLILTAQDGVDDRVRGLDAGADDYLTKPFALPELFARVRALTRRGTGNPTRIEVGGLSYDQSERIARLNGEIVELSARELALLEILLLRAGRLVGKDQLVDQLCSWGEEVSNNAIEVYIHRLRKKLESGGPRITTVRGLGYCLEKPAEQPMALRKKLGKAKPAGNPFVSFEYPNSLFGEILDWMLAPLLLLWPISIAATNHVASYLANQPYDQHLADNVTAIVRLVKVDGERVTVNLPASARTVLRTDETDLLLYQVVAPNTKVVQGDRDIPWPPLPNKLVSGKVMFRDDRIEGENVRIAYAFIPVRDGLPPAVVQVAETLRKREALSGSIISGVLLPQFAVIPLAVILVYMGLSRGIAPLRLLQQRIHRRRPTDLSPIPVTRVPDEVRPLVVAFNQMMERLEENLQAQQRFIAQAAHQMRTPLTGLKTQTEIALSETDPAQMRLALKLIAESTDRAAHMINQLLILARAESSHEKLHQVVPVDLDALAREVSSEWVMRALAKDIDLGFETCGCVLLIDGVPLLLRELLTNLVDNAIKYTQRGGHVTVRTRAAETAIIEVEDDGIGIPPEERESVFERFYRVLGTDAEGSGLGLPIAAEIAELHRAKIELAEGPKGRGCLFRVIFLRRSEARPAVDPHRPSAGNFPLA